MRESEPTLQGVPGQSSEHHRDDGSQCNAAILSSSVLGSSQSLVRFSTQRCDRFHPVGGARAGEWRMMMPSFEINHRLRDTGGVVGDPLEVARSIHQFEPGVKLLGVLAQTGLELLAQHPVLRVDGGVAGDDVLGPRRCLGWPEPGNLRVPGRAHREPVA